VSEATTTTTTTGPALDDARIAGFAAGLRGRVITPADDGYDGARRVWNGMIDKRPGLIVMAAGVADVVAAVNLAREHDLLVAVRGGGHNVAGTAVNDGGIVIDLSMMRAVRVDPERRTVWAQGGSTWGDVDRETQPFGLAVPGGVVSQTGIAGLTLSGGYSSQRRAHGMSIDNLIACEIVTADGRYLRASDIEHPDLFWALRGGGGNFGVVTAFEYRAHPHGPEVYELKVFYPVEQARQVLAAWRDAVDGARDEITADAVFWAFPAVPELPAEMHGVPFLLVTGTYAGPVEEGDAAMRPLRELGTPLVDASGVVDYLTLQSSLDGLVPAGRRYYWKGLYLSRLDDEAIGLIAERALSTPSRLGPIVVRQLGGAMARMPAEATAFGDRSAPFHLSIDTAWESAEDDARNIEWTRSFWSAAQRFSSGQVYFNFAGLLEEGEEALRTSYGRNYERLVDVKTAYDPTNLFRLNPNIAPRR
jgi:FAD/FMN-containing dehydrogenase